METAADSWGIDRGQVERVLNGRVGGRPLVNDERETEVVSKRLGVASLAGCWWAVDDDRNHGVGLVLVGMR